MHGQHSRLCSIKVSMVVVVVVTAGFHANGALAC